MLKLFISAPMEGRTHKEAEQERDRLITEARKVLSVPVRTGICFLPWMYWEPNRHSTLRHLSRCFPWMEGADYVIFDAGEWKKDRVCRIEHLCAELCEIPILEV